MSTTKAGIAARNLGNGKKSILLIALLVESVQNRGRLFRLFRLFHVNEKKGGNDSVIRFLQSFAVSDRDSSHIPYCLHIRYRLAQRDR